MRQKPPKVLVVQMKSVRGKDVPYQYVITTPDGQYFQSHGKIVAFIPFAADHKTMLDKQGWNVSKTTSKYRNAFLHETRQETERKIREGVYAVGDLN